MKLQVPDWLRPVFGSDLLWRVHTSAKVVYLTFDDGPVPEVTSRVLGILDEYGWKATFFCVGENVVSYPELYRRLINEGHRVGNHSFNHIKGFGLSDEAYLHNVEKARKYIDSDLFRPPHGQITRSQTKKLSENFRVVMWDIISFDYDASMEAETIMKLIRRKSRPGTIVVFHDSIRAEKNLFEVLPKALAYWKGQGYSFGLL